MTHPQSQSEPPIDSEDFLKVFFTVTILWWLLWLQLLHQTNFIFTLKIFGMVKLRELGYKNPSHTNRVFLSLSLPPCKRPSNRCLITPFKYQFKSISNRVSNEQVMGILHC